MLADRRGVTLVELLIALSLTGLTLAVAVGISHAALKVDERLVEDILRYERAISGEQLLMQLLRQAASSSNAPVLFEGSADVARFSSRCPTATGTSTSCEVVLQLTERGDSTVLRGEWSGYSSARLSGYGRGARFGYIGDDDAGSRWHPAWASSAGVPRAVGVITAADTLILWVGPR